MADEKKKQEKKPTMGLRDLHLKPLYDRYAIDKQSNGETPEPYAEWVKKNTKSKD